jgi:anti-sigma regulatory factor (Ser/Thr protein kinase)
MSAVNSVVNLRFEMRSDAAELSRARAWIVQVAEHLGLEPHAGFALKAAASEALSNVIRHSYGGREGLPILLTCVRRRGRVLLAIRDYGRKARGVFRRPSPPAPHADSAYGLWILHCLVDRVRVDHTPEEGNILTLTVSDGEPS